MIMDYILMALWCFTIGWLSYEIWIANKRAEFYRRMWKEEMDWNGKMHYRAKWKDSERNKDHGL